MAQHNYEDLDPTDTPSRALTTIQDSRDQPFNPRCAHNPMETQCTQSQYTNPNHNFAPPQFMAQPNCEDLQPTDTPSAVPSALQASSDHTFNPRCAHNLMETQCNQPQYLTSLNKICAHNPSASQNNQVSLSNSLASPYPPNPGEHVLERSVTEVGKQDFLVKWFKFIHTSPKPRMTETPVQKPVHVAYSPIVSMNYQWTSGPSTSMMDIPLSKFWCQKSIFHPLFITSATSSQPCFTLVMITFVPPKSYYPVKTMGRD